MHTIICKDGVTTLYSERYQQAYHSVNGAITQSRQVFLNNSGVLNRLSAGLACNILEIGFGLGLNFLVTAKAAQELNSQINYTAYEFDLISSKIFNSLNYGPLLNCPNLAESLSQIFENRNSTGSSEERKLSLPFVKLSLKLTNVIDLKVLPNSMHAVYLDAFSPQQNLECWSTELLVKIYDSLISGGVLSTYSVQGEFRRKLKSIGFSVKKLPGPPGKREVLIAYR